MSDRVVITGLGTVNALGLSVRETWENVIHGVSGVAPITLFDPSKLLVQIACEVKGFIPEDYLPVREARRRERFQQFATVAAREAIDQAGLEVAESESGRVGVIVSSAIGGVQVFEDSVYTLMEDGPRRISPFVIPMLMSNGAAGLIAIDHGYNGPCLSVGSACASGADGIGMAWHLIRSGVIDVAIAGASDATITPIAVAAFDRLGAMSRLNQEYCMTPRPFDLNRDGLVMGEGAAILVLEHEERARKRGAEILADLAGYAATSDAFHITAPSETGEGGAQAMRLAMQAARIKPEEVDYINAHGTATQLNDISETLAIKAALGDLAYKIPVSSTKSMTGHMMGTTGALEAILCVMVLRKNVIPPTIHYETPDPECDLDYVPNESREHQTNAILSNAFGFGGHNAVLALKSYS